MESTFSQTLSAVQNWRDFQKSPEGVRLFPGLESLRWFIRQHGDDLLKAGALIKIRGQWHVVRPEFDQSVIQLMRTKAIASLQPAAAF